MKSTELLNKVKEILNIPVTLEESKEVKLEIMTLQNGTVVEAERFEKGAEIFIKSDDEKIALPVGEYVMSDGKLLVVKEEGVIDDFRVVGDDVPAKEITEDLKYHDKDKKMKKDDEKEMKEHEEDEKKKMAEHVNVDKEGNMIVKIDDWKAMEERIANLEVAINKLKGEKMEASKTIEELEQQLSAEPAVEAIQHSPENNTEVKKEPKYGRNRPMTMSEKVLERISNIN